MTSKDDIMRWFIEHKKKGYKYMVIMVDTFDYEDYPVGYATDEECLKAIDEPQKDMQKVMEVYNLEEDMFEQMSFRRCYNPPKRN